ncbi:hypothetical protein N7G274_002410 [Stereocaulon virgatum]|uniref:Zn(2)-C6 fungal-type domain-containing protein n=1 Tax=Stereocaulon virgatum TaxID=373712 RepID=A0ABR4AHT2_9LECA
MATGTSHAWYLRPRDLPDGVDGRYNIEPKWSAMTLGDQETPTSSSSACIPPLSLQDLDPSQETHGSQSALPSPEATPRKPSLTGSAGGSRTQDGMTFHDEPYPAEVNNFYTTSPTQWSLEIHSPCGYDGLPSPSAWPHDYSQDVQTQGMDLLFSGSSEPLDNQNEHPYSSREHTGGYKYHANPVRTLRGNMATFISLSEGQNTIMRPPSRPDYRDFTCLNLTPAMVKSESVPPGLSLHGSLGELDTGTALEGPQPLRNLSHNRQQSTLNSNTSIPKRRKTRKLSAAGKRHATLVKKSGGACKPCQKKKTKCLHKLPEDRALYTPAAFNPNVGKTETGARPFDPVLYSPTQELAHLEPGGLM